MLYALTLLTHAKQPASFLPLATATALAAAADDAIWKVAQIKGAIHRVMILRQLTLAPTLTFAFVFRSSHMDSRWHVPPRSCTHCPKPSAWGQPTDAGQTKGASTAPTEPVRNREGQDSIWQDRAGQGRARQRAGDARPEGVGTWAGRDALCRRRELVQVGGVRE